MDDDYGGVTRPAAHRHTHTAMIYMIVLVPAATGADRSHYDASGMQGGTIPSATHIVGSAATAGGADPHSWRAAWWAPTNMWYDAD